jgi:hypothetical protein
MEEAVKKGGRESRRGPKTSKSTQQNMKTVQNTYRSLVMMVWTASNGRVSCVQTVSQKKETKKMLELLKTGTDFS